jgi:hypothetical protein
MVKTAEQTGVLTAAYRRSHGFQEHKIATMYLPIDLVHRFYKAARIIHIRRRICTLSSVDASKWL